MSFKQIGYGRELMYISMFAIWYAFRLSPQKITYEYFVCTYIYIYLTYNVQDIHSYHISYRKLKITIIMWT